MSSYYFFFVLTLLRYFHRPLNFEKLVDLGFSSLPWNMTMEKMVEKFNLKVTLKGSDISSSDLSSLLDGLRVMTVQDVPYVCKLLNGYMESFKFAPIFTEKDLEHWLLPRDGLLFSFVVDKKISPVDSASNPISAFVSFYSLPSHVLPKKDPLNPSSIFSKGGAIKDEAVQDRDIQTAYLYYAAFESKLDAEKDIVPLMKALLAIAKSRGFDVFNCLNTSQNHEFLETLRFQPGDGKLRFYLYNWKTDPIDAKEVALIML
jgi:glycylpeptide N-tetradecanoyltransferase